MAGNGFEEFLRTRAEQHRLFLEKHGWLDGSTGGPRIDLLEPLLSAHVGEDHYPLPEGGLSDVVASAREASVANEYLGRAAAALAWYRIGAYRWRGGRAFRDPMGTERTEMFSREDAARFQLPAAVCADRAGWRERAVQLYGWAAHNRALTDEEKSRLIAPWEVDSYVAYPLACLERWEEALTAAEEAEEALRRDRGARRRQPDQAPLRVLDMVHVLARYKVHPTEENRRAAEKALELRAAASPSFGDQLEALFYLYNLRARHPELVEDKLSPAKGRNPPEPFGRLSHPNGVFSLAFSPGPSRLAAGLSNGRVWLWKMPEASAVRHWSAHPNAIRALDFSPDGRLLVTAANRSSGSRDPNLRVWEAERGKRLHDLRGHELSVLGAAFTADGRLLASAGDDATVRLWDVATGREQRSWGSGEPLEAVAVLPDGKWLAAGGGAFHGRILLIPLQAGERRVLEDHGESECLADPDQPVADHVVTHMALGRRDLLAAGAQDGTIQVWDTGAGRCLWKQEGAHSFQGVTALAVAGDCLVSAGWDGLVRGWGLRDGASLWQLKHDTSVRATAPSSDGTLLAVGFGDGSVVLYTLT